MDVNGTPIILVVDDIEANRETLIELLTPEGYLLQQASTGPEALKLAAQTPPDLILSDVMMPGMDGFEVCRRLRADAILAEVPIILVTALDDQASRLEGIRAGADDFITKPFNRIELRARVRSITRLNRYRRLTDANKRIREQADLLDQARDAIIVCDLEGRITYSNRSTGHLFGRSAEETVGRPFADLFPESVIDFAQVRAAVTETGEHVEQVTLSRNNGISIILESRWSAVCGAAGEPRGLMMANTDVTENKKLEAQILRNQRVESLGSLAGGIAHDLNNALAPILMSSQLLRMKFDDPDTLRTLDVLESSAKRGAEMVKQVLTFARGIEGKRGTVQLKHLIRDMAAMAKHTFPKSIQVKEQVEKVIWAITGDATQLHQVILNLCVNARDAMPGGGVLTLAAENIYLDKDYVRAYPDAKPGPYVALSVSDTGTGMPPHVQARIFEPFFTTKEAGKGTGLGLSTVQNIVKNHSGFLTLESAPNKGTQFKLFFPAIVSGTESDAQAAQLVLPSGKGEWILVVDDEALVRDIARQMLQTFGYHVLVAANGAEAVVIFAQNVGKIRVLMTDLALPIMDGPAAIEAARSIDPEIRVIVASGSESDVMTNKHRSATVQAILEKPYTPEKLLTTIHNVLNTPKTQTIDLL